MGGFLSPTLAWGGLALGGNFCLLSVTWGGPYGGLLEPRAGLGWSRAGRVLFALDDLGWSRTGLGWSRAGRALFLGRVSFALGDLGWSVWGLLEPRAGLGGLQLGEFFVCSR